MKKCPDCGGTVELVVSAPAVQFKGSGWYVNDYAKKPSAQSSSNGEPGSKVEAASKTDSESKGESESKSKKEENSKQESSTSGKKGEKKASSRGKA
jgi:predicted nucleic acid-binding Zn ribbon protein